jgi:hypothetical protein
MTRAFSTLRRVDVDVDSDELARENARLRERVAELESELADQAARANAAVARAQERVYWLDRWHIDLNALMTRPGAGAVRGLLRALRWPLRQARIAKRRLLG